MKRFLPLVVLTIEILVATNVLANTYYIAASGSDSSIGTSKTSPWLHAPGMKNCTATCASTVPKPGDQFIFRGGDTWHYGNSSASPYVGAYQSGFLAYWAWQWNGSSSSTIYIGVDKTWFSGSSWVRPIMTGDNAPSTSVVSSCTYDQGGQDFLILYAINYVTVDNFEWTGKCWSTSGSSSYAGATIYDYEGLNDSFLNNYFHGWTVTPGAYDYNVMIRGNDAPTYVTNTEIGYNIFDGSDSSQGTTTSACQYAVNGAPCTSGMALELDAWNVHHNIFRYLSNGWISNNTHIVHDNLFEYLYNSVTGCWSNTGKNCTGGPNDGPHPNIFNTDGNAAGTDVYFYNNVVRHAYQNVGLWFNVPQTIYFFNNVLYDMASVGPQNCIMLQNNTSASTTAYIYNNTVDGSTGCSFNFNVANGPAPAWNGTANWQNNHFIAYTALSGTYTCQTPLTCGIDDKGNEVYQSESVANSQGYVAANSYAPTAASNATVGAGLNLTSSCAAFSTDSAFCSGTTDGVSETVGDGGKVATSPAIPLVSRPPTGAWDVGAYEFGSTTQPNPPTGLSAIVQ